ncbi:hypothetical protein Tco_1195013 [Tanacetum coccineum]
MSINKQTPLSQPTSVVRNTLGKEPVSQDPGRPISDEALREYCDMNYHHIPPIIAEKVHQEKAQQEKLKAVKAGLNFEETSHHSESGTPIRRRDLKGRLGPRYVRSRSGSPETRCSHSKLPKKKGSERKTVFKRLEKGVFYRLRDKGKSVSMYSDDSRRRSYHSSHRDTESCHQSSRSKATEPVSARCYNKRASSKKTEELLESEGSAGGHWKSKLKRLKSSIEDDLSQPWGTNALWIQSLHLVKLLLKSAPDLFTSTNVEDETMGGSFQTSPPRVNTQESKLKLIAAVQGGSRKAGRKVNNSALLADNTLNFLTNRFLIRIKRCVITNVESEKRLKAVEASTLTPQSSQSTETNLTLKESIDAGKKTPGTSQSCKTDAGFATRKEFYNPLGRVPNHCSVVRQDSEVAIIL